MGNLKSAFTSAALAGIDEMINAIADPALRATFKTMAFAVKVPYALLKELLPEETDTLITAVLTSEQMTQEILHSPEFQQALGNTLDALTHAKEKVKRDIIKKVFTQAYLSNDEYAKNHMERLNDVTQRISIPALQHVVFLKQEILPMMDADVEGKMNPKTTSIGYSPDEYRQKLKRTTAISNYYDVWHTDRKQEITKNYHRNQTEEKRRIFDLSDADEQKRREQFSEIWAELNTLNIFRQGNNPAIGTVGGGGGTVQYLTTFGDQFMFYVASINTE